MSVIEHLAASMPAPDPASDLAHEPGPAPAPGAADRGRLSQALGRARIGFFEYRPFAHRRDDGPDVDRTWDSGTWEWAGADFGISGITGRDGLARLRDAVAPAERRNLLDMFHPAASTHPRVGEFRVQGPDGLTVYLALQASLETDARTGGDGRVAVFGTVRDVTGPRHVQAAAHDAGDGGRGGEPGDDQAGMVIASLDAGPVSITIADATRPDMPLIYANQMFLRLTGYDASEVIGRNCRFLQGPATDPAVVADIGAALAAGRHIEAILVNYRKDGTAFLNRLVLDPIHDDAGTLTGFFAAQIDITEEAARKAEAERQTRQARERMMDGVAHEMNNLLQPVALLGQDVIDQGLVGDEGRAHFDALVECGKTARVMIDDLLLAARRGSDIVLKSQLKGTSGHGIDTDH